MLTHDHTLEDLEIVECDDMTFDLNYDCFKRTIHLICPICGKHFKCDELWDVINHSDVVED